MQRILATIAILAMAACGSAAQTGPKTTNPPLTADQKAKNGGDPHEQAPKDVGGLTIQIGALEFQLTMTAGPWKFLPVKKSDGTVQLAFQRPDIPALMIVFPSKAENTDAKSYAEEWQKQATAAGATASPVTAETNGRYAFTADVVVDGQTYRTYVGMVPHPVVKDGYLIFMAKSDSKTSDAFLKDVRAIADSVGPIQ